MFHILEDQAQIQLKNKVRNRVFIKRLENINTGKGKRAPGIAGIGSGLERRERDTQARTLAHTNTHAPPFLSLSLSLSILCLVVPQSATRIIILVITFFLLFVLYYILFLPSSTWTTAFTFGEPNFHFSFFFFEVIFLSYARNAASLKFSPLFIRESSSHLARIRDYFAAVARFSLFYYIVIFFLKKKNCDMDVHIGFFKLFWIIVCDGRIETLH